MLIFSAVCQGAGPDDLGNEAGRLLRRPVAEPTALLGLIAVRPVTDAVGFAARLRELLHAAVLVARDADFDEEDVPVASLPGWFLDLDEAAAGRCVRDRGGEPWSTTEWIYAFDPELRAWSWWDATEGPGGRVPVWVDTRGEGHLPMEKPWWAVYAAGGEDVLPSTLEEAGRWREWRTLAPEGDPQDT
ncbi:hypothetical protein GCM10014713_53630 [Streptomyces purpureus]|uniref:Uncharacterized protein n=1 Tax=Streptomyces purpureus TaxID=1951 RepID=A0A918HDH0_9ACTN|nr:hypothetical protein GCM10014713_53630 [Streptomyces purpureus]